MLPETKEYLTLFISALTPITTAIVGVIFIRRAEKIKLAVTKSYDFKKKWADDFYEACKEYMACIERYLSLLKMVASCKNNDALSVKCIDELNQLNIKIPEVDVRIRRMSLFCPNHSNELLQSGKAIQDYITQMIKTVSGNFDDAINLLNNFNEIANKAHKEILESK